MISQKIKWFFGALVDWAYILWDAVVPRDYLLPPRRLVNSVGGGDYGEIGREFFRYFIDIAGLKSSYRVLDVGCGCGRMAVPLIPFLSGASEYQGFDIVPAAITWSQSHITSRHPRFHFELADIYNKLYNPKGKIKSKDYRFPYADNYFDFTFLTSVFTHMFTDDMERYLSEIARTLKPDGKCMITFFLLNSESKNLIEQGASTLPFRHPLPGCVTAYPEMPEGAIAFEESFIRQCFAKYQLDLVEPIHFGGWCGRNQRLSYQDIILAVKKNRV